MPDVIEEKREKRKSPSRVEFDERKRIAFHIASVQGLPQSKWSSVGSNTFVTVENIETQEALETEHKKSSATITWSENLTFNDLTDSSKIRFELRQSQLWTKSTLGKTSTFELRELLHMQVEAGEGLDALIDLVITLSPPTPANTRPTTPHPPSPKRLSSQKSNTAILSLNIREMAVKDRNCVRTAADTQRFVDKCQDEALGELSGVIEKVNHLRRIFEGSAFVCLVDILLGALEGVRKAVVNPTTKNINKNTVECIRALNSSFTSFDSFTAKKVAKQGENATVMMKEMLCGAVFALESMEIFLRRNNTFESDKLEFKVTDWLAYFEKCGIYLSGVDPEMRKPEALISKKSRRVPCLASMNANPLLPASNMIPMRLPEIYASGSYDRPDLVRLVAEWVFSTSFRHDSSTAMAEANVIKPKSTNVLCLSGPAGSGKTQLAAHICEWLKELSCLGGYYTLRKDKDALPPSERGNRTSECASMQARLDALPVTLAHQACTVEPHAANQLIDAFAKNPSALDGSLETRFETLFAAPMRAFTSGRPGAAWNPLPPLVFILDGLVGTSQSSSSTQQAISEDAEIRRVNSLFTELILSKSVAGLPNHVKFLILARSDTKLSKTMAEKGIGFVCDIKPIVQYVEAGSSSSVARLRGGASGSSGASGSGLPPSSSVKVSMQSF